MSRNDDFHGNDEIDRSNAEEFEGSSASNEVGLEERLAGILVEGGEGDLLLQWLQALDMRRREVEAFVEDECLKRRRRAGSVNSAVLRHGVRGLVIDPYNELDHQRPPNQTETEYVSQMLTNVKRFAQHHACHVWFVAHPRQLHHWVGGPPNLYDISGSAHFINKCDNGIVIHRNRDPDAGDLDKVQVCVRKVRNKVAGTIGDAYLSYDRATGRYVDIPKGK